MTGVREIGVQFELEIEHALRPLIEHHGPLIPLGLGQALGVACGLPYPSDVRVTLRYGARTHLDVLRGVTPRKPHPLEVQGLLYGTLFGLHAALDARIQALSLRGDRVTDA